VLGVGCWVLGVGCWVLGVGCWVLAARTDLCIVQKGQNVESQGVTES
jgi:type IV secretory pathway TrbD component